MLFSANRPEIFERIPTHEKSKTPWIRNAFQPSSRTVVFSGTFFVMHTNVFSASVFPKKHMDHRNAPRNSRSLYTLKNPCQSFWCPRCVLLSSAVVQPFTVYRQAIPTGTAAVFFRAGSFCRMFPRQRCVWCKGCNFGTQTTKSRPTPHFYLFAAPTAA